jgi:hypothetical protein
MTPLPASDDVNYPASQIKPGYEQFHRHYNRQDFIRLLNYSNFKGRYEVKAVFRGKLIAGVLAGNLI